MKTLTLGSLFAGTGGFELAAQRNGIDVLWNCEIDELKRKKLKKNFPHVEQFGDIRDCRNPPHVDILTGGFPCQDISITNQSKKGTKGIQGERSGLWKEYARILGEIRPSVVIFENSPRITVSGLEHVLCDFARYGYNVEWRCFFASQFGLPHYRKRLYGVAYAKGSGWDYNLKNGGLLAKVLLRKSSSYKSTYQTMPVKRYDSSSDYESVRMDDGFSKELDKSRIHDCGNAVVVDIAEAILKVVKNHWPN